MKTVVVVLKSIAILLTGGVIVVSAGLYVAANQTPQEYIPLYLSDGEKQLAAKQFIRRIQDFGNDAQQNEPYLWSLTQEQLNAYLASLDEIAANMPGGKAGTVQKAMQRIGLTTPTLKLEKDVLTLMVRSAKYNKVISTDFSFSFTPDKKLRVSILQTRMGRLAMPDTFVRSHLEKLQNTLKAARPSPKTKPASRRSSLLVGLSSSQLGAVLAAVIAAVDQEPISTELLWPIRKKRVRVEGIEIDDRQLTLYVVPIDRITGG